MVSICNDRLIWSCILRGLICHGNRYLLSNNASSIIGLLYPLKKIKYFQQAKILRQVPSSGVNDFRNRSSNSDFVFRTTNSFYSNLIDFGRDSTSISVNDMLPFFKLLLTLYGFFSHLLDLIICFPCRL